MPIYIIFSSYLPSLDPCEIKTVIFHPDSISLYVPSFITSDVKGNKHLSIININYKRYRIYTMTIFCNFHILSYSLQKSING